MHWAFHFIHDKKSDCSTEIHYLPQGRGLMCQSCNHNPHCVQEYLAELDPRLLREVGCVKDRGMVSWNHNEVCDFLFMKNKIESRLITWYLTWRTYRKSRHCFSLTIAMSGSLGSIHGSPWTMHRSLGAIHRGLGSIHGRLAVDWAASTSRTTV